ncbi:MAG: LolA family protein [Solirubrobacterales bacterium]
MRFLRRISTRQLLALCVSVAALVIGGTVLAMATTSSGPKPSPKKLPVAVHDALTAPPVKGVTARIQFTNHLIDSGSVQGVDPLLTGATGRLWASSDGRVRLELQSDPSSNGGTGDVQVLLDHNHATVYDSGTNAVYDAKLPAGEAGEAGKGSRPSPSLAEIRGAIRRAATHVLVSGATPSDVAGQPAYTVRVSPKRNGGLLGGAELAWDAVHGTPLRAAVYAAGDSSPVLELKVTDISFGPVSRSVFDVTPPASAKVTSLTPPARRAADRGRRATPVIGLAAVQKRISFSVTAPPKLAGRSRDETRLISSGDHAGVLITYGRGLGGVAVIEGPADTKGVFSAGSNTGGNGEQPGPRLPEVSINGSTGQELDTALGTVLRFQRRGVQYVVAGSAPPAAVEAAARGL